MDGVEPLELRSRGLGEAYQSFLWRINPKFDIGRIVDAVENIFNFEAGFETDEKTKPKFRLLFFLRNEQAIVEKEKIARFLPLVFWIIEVNRPFFYKLATRCQKFGWFRI